MKQNKEDAAMFTVVTMNRRYVLNPEEMDPLSWVLSSIPESSSLTEIVSSQSTATSEPAFSARLSLLLSELSKYRR